MNNEKAAAVKEICSQYNNESTRLIDVLRAVQRRFNCVDEEAVDAIAGVMSIPRVEVDSTLTFYAFLSKEPMGSIVIRLCDDIVDRMFGAETVAQAFEKELGIRFGETTPDGLISLRYTPFIGMGDQAPAALVNDEVVTYLSSDKAREIVGTLRKTKDPADLVHRLGDGKNADKLVRSMVHNNIRKKGEVVFGEYEENSGLKKALAMSPIEVITEVKNARLRGRGGAGFPAGMKWEFTRGTDDPEKYIVCNADEGEPGTFKDRVLLTELAGRIFEGMTIAGYAIGAEHGILYLRAEYAYLENLLENELSERRKSGLLGKDVLGKAGFCFDIELRVGAGAYVCGEETALISSAEGRRGDPKNRPPFPAQQGYLGHPTDVNNVETFCSVTRIMDKGAAWFTGIGSKGSTGTKLLSVSGDCRSPGVYEYPFGISVRQLLHDVGAEDCRAVQIGGASGQMISEEDFEKTICYDDLATGGSVMVFSRDRNILDIADYYMDFFIEESCGYCTPCRAGNVVMKKLLGKVINGRASSGDLARMEQLGKSIKAASRCGFGQTSPNPILTTLEHFRNEYESRLETEDDGFEPAFNLKDAVGTAESIVGRTLEESR